MGDGLGFEHFDDRAARRLGQKSRRRYEKLRQDPLAQALVTRLARDHRISLRDLMQGGRGSGNASHTRQIAMYLCYVLLRRTQEQLAELFNRDRKTVSHACLQIELQRETDRALDKELMAFESDGWVEAARRDEELPRHAA
jgi:chromosomal replication initiation ATPase DnaA